MHTRAQRVNTFIVACVTYSAAEHLHRVALSPIISKRIVAKTDS